MNLPVLTNAHSADRLIEIVSARLALAGVVDFRSPPAHPTGCCGRGCNGCVWEGYFSALAYWRDEALLRLGGIDPGGEVMAN
ncbi:oxidoreductase-like domain-containing protein [Xylophilus sp. GOD-11R]|uniref:oxidoreductase-like domain-containing protein n=1 Tax=Xylophilus sp. GOD-11R TaxID=3089814 RepID=UPI00298CBC70|nr:oxidoreductase-like domain-containing protein [Xylophilus sp. GOD-11R]WPB57226.1 oxidoreductase-like domain-containing protein [Xylophilus sp. GOD-11R]